MLYTQFNMDDALEVRYEEGLEEGLERGIQQGLKQGIQQGLEQGLAQGLTQGIQQGLSQGERRLMIRLVCGKLRKGESSEKIAGDLLADRKEIDRICEAYMKYGQDEAVLFDKLDKVLH